MIFKKKLSPGDKQRLENDKQNEKWNGSLGNFKSFMNSHLSSIGIGNRPERDDLDRGARGETSGINWSRVAPNIRMEYIRRRIRNATKEALEDLDDIRGIKNGVPNAKKRKGDGDNHDHKKKKKRKKKKHRPRKPHETPDPSPTPVDVDEEFPPIPPIRPPEPRPQESPPRPPLPRKVKWDSRVGYFVTLSDLTWYSEAPRIHESPYVDFHFTDRPNQYLSLNEGQTWESEWQQSGVIRGLNIDIVGKHKLNYSTNGDFEV